MIDEEKIIRVYSGSEILALMLKAELEENGIGAMIRNDFQSGVLAGFVDGLPSMADLYIREADAAEASPVIKTFIEFNDEHNHG
jgi:hypothetical protein